MRSSLFSPSLSPFLLLLAVLLFNSRASYASVVKSRALSADESSSPSSLGLEERGWNWWRPQKLAPGAICTSNNQCIFGSCFNGVCLALANRPANAPCLLTLQCNSQDFCSRGKCAVKLAGGQTCTSGSQCQSNVCQRQLRQLVCKAVATPTSPSSPTGTAALSSAASAAIASATTVSSTPFTGTGGPLLSLGAGTIKAIGAVSVVAGKIQLAATSAQPAYFQDTFAQAVTKRGSIQRRQAASTFFSFNYAVSNFVANPTTSICQLIPSVNGVNLSPPINITSGTTSGTGNFVVNSGSITSFGTAVVCMTGASGTVTPSNFAFQAVNLPPSSTTTTSIIPSSISFSTVSTPTTVSIPPTSSPTASPTTGCYNIAFGNATADGTLGNDNCQADKSTVSLPASFFNNNLSNQTAQALLEAQCQGMCNANAACISYYTSQGPFGQGCALLPRLATTADFICSADPTTGYKFLAYNKCSGVDSTTITTSITNPTSTTSPTSSVSPSPTTSPTCSGWPNCSFESGSLSVSGQGFAQYSSGGGGCSVTTAYAHSGTNSAVCDLPQNLPATDGVFLYAEIPDPVAGQMYTLTWYIKVADGATVAGVSATVTDDSGQGSRIPVTVTSSNEDDYGWTQFAFSFTATSNDMELSIDMYTPGTYYLDDFSMSPSVFPIPSTSTTDTTSTSTITPTGTAGVATTE